MLAHGRATAAARLRLAPALLLFEPELPRAGAAHHRAVGRALWPSSGGCRLADRQRVRLPRHGAELLRRPRKPAFRRWLQRRYGSVEALNDAWGTVFWSQEYRNFDEVDLPVATVTEANPSHRLDSNTAAA